jgi:hypothetical protein
MGTRFWICFQSGGPGLVGTMTCVHASTSARTMTTSPSKIDDSRWLLLTDPFAAHGFENNQRGV